MARLNEFQWTSQEQNGIGSGVAAERIRGGVSVRVTNGTSYMGFNLTKERAFDLAAFISECVVSEMRIESDIAKRTAPVTPTENGENAHA